MASTSGIVTGGVDTHKDVHVAAALDERGALLATASFPATGTGYDRLHQWLSSFGRLGRVGIEGTGSYGAGLTRSLHAAGIDVVEVNRPDRQLRRRLGKSDPVDAEAAARTVLADRAAGVPKSSDGPVEGLRALRVARRSAIKARTQAGNQIRDLIVSAPQQLREPLSGLGLEIQVARCAASRPGSGGQVEQATKRSLRHLARRHQALSAEIAELDRDIDELCAAANPALLAVDGIGPEVASMLLVAAGDNPDRMRHEAAFAALCGASPVQASSGKTVRHRLNRGGNREANNALWRIAMVRLATVTIPPRLTCTAVARKAGPIGRSCVASSATSHGRYSTRSPIPKTSPEPLTCACSASRPVSRLQPLPATSASPWCGYPVSSAASCTRPILQTPTKTGSTLNHHQPLDTDRSIQGAEMAEHRAFAAATNFDVYFADAGAPWQRGSNENTNGLLRQYFPRGTDLAAHTVDKLLAVAEELNDRPRKSLDWDTPAERLSALLEVS